jgi:general secretion pathway protein O
MVLADTMIFVLTWLVLGPVLQLPAILLAAQPLLLIMVADAKTRIIPDQFTLALLPCATLLWLTDSLSGQTGWLPGLLFRLLGGLAGGLLLFICGWLAEKLLHREAMGMGDIKLLAACGLLTSLAGLPMLLVLAFLSAAFLAIPLLVRRLRDPERSSDMPFGPFIALAALLVMILAEPIRRLWALYTSILL